jgi:hypothetical protein
MGTVGRLPDFHRVLYAKCMPYPCAEHRQSGQARWRPHNTRSPEVRRSRSHPGKLLRRARDDEILPDANRSSWRRFSVESSMGHVHRARSVGRPGNRGARGAGDENSRGRQDAIILAGVEGRTSPGYRATWCALRLVLRHAEDAGFVVPGFSRAFLRKLRMGSRATSSSRRRLARVRSQECGALVRATACPRRASRRRSP